MASEHTKSGNCWAVAHSCRRCGSGVVCDGCHQHDEPRGDCSVCRRCVACDEEHESSAAEEERSIATDPREDDRFTRGGTTVMVDRVANGQVYFSRWRDGQMYMHADLVRLPLPEWTRLVQAETPAAAGSGEEGGHHG